MACRALAALLVFLAQRVAADYDAAVAEGILTSLELELKLPWMTVDFDTEVIASGAAMKENYTLVDPDILKHALFAGIKAAGDAVFMHYVGTEVEGQFYGYYNYGTGEEGLYSCEFHDTNASCIEKWNFTRANMMECPETGAKGYNCHGSCDSCSGRVELAESLGIQASGHCLMGITIDQETGLTTSDWNDGSTMWYSPGFYDPRFRGWYIDAKAAGQRKWSSIYVFNNPGNPVGITAARPIYAPFTGELVGVAGIDFVLSAIETLVSSFVPDDGSMMAFLLDGQTSSMLGSSIAGVATNSDGMNSVFDCGIPEMEAAATFLWDKPYNDTNVYSIMNNTWWVQQAWFYEEWGLEWRIVVLEKTNCPAGYALDLDSTNGECFECIAPKTSLLGATDCTLCVEGYYFNDVTEGCEKCPAGATCLNAAESIDVDEGFWRTLDNSFHLWECPMNGCVGGPSSGNQLCKPGFTGVMCSVCATDDANGDTYFYEGKECKKCKGSEGGMVAGATIAFVVLITVLVASAMFGYKILKVSKQKYNRLYRKFMDTFWDIAKFKVVFAAYQIVASVTWSLEITFPEPYQSFQALLSVVMDFSIAGIFPMTCLMGFSYHSHILVVTIFPLVLILGFGSLYLSATQASASHKVAPPTLKAGTADKASLYLQAALMVSFLSLPTSSTALFRTFHCKAFDNGEDYLIADYSINCASAAHQGFMIYSGLMFMVFPIGTPLVYFVLLRAARDRINPPAADSEFQAIRMRSEDSTLTHIRPMYAIYRPSMWYFEIIDVCRRIIMIGVLIFEDDLALRAAIGSIIAIVVAVAYREAEPYSSSTVNSLSTMATWLVAVVYLSGVVITGTPFEYENWALSLVLLGFFLVVIGMAVWLQVVKGSSRVEVEHKMLEQEAREIDLKLSLDEMIGNTDTIRKSELLAEGERLLNEQLDGMRGATNVSVVMTASGEKATHWAELGGMTIKRSFGFHEKDGFNETLYPCYVMEHTTMQAVSRLPFHEDALKADQLEELRNDTRAPSPSHTYFISQNWEGALGSGPGGQGKHPDNSLNTKLLWLKNIKKHLHIPQDVNVWIWIDVCSVPQTDKIAQRKAVSSLCYYCQLCTRFMPLVRNEAVWRQLHSATEAELDAATGKEGETCCTLPAGNLEAYAGRGWCRVEVLAALCPKKTLTGKWRSGPINIRYRFHHDASKAGIGPMLKETPLFNPMEGGFTSETDRPIVVEITKRIAQRYRDYVDSGSQAWGETLDMAKLPEWVMDAGQKGVVAKITRPAETNA